MTPSPLPPEAELRRQTLEKLMCMIAQQPAITLTTEQAAQTWSIELDTWRVTAPTADLTLRDEDHCRGVATHEAAHAAITRLGDMIPHDIIRRPGIHALLNTLEDLRIEDWVTRRFPGTAPWIARCNADLWPAHAPWRHDPMPRSLQYNFCLIRKQLGHKIPANTPADVMEAVERTWDVVQRVVAAQPSAGVFDHAAVIAVYEQSHLKATYWADDQDAPPSPFEMGVRLQQWRAWELIFTEIMPTYEALLAQDQATNDHDLAQALQRWLAQVRAMSSARRGAGRRRGRWKGKGKGSGQVVADAAVAAALGIAPSAPTPSAGSAAGVGGGAGGIDVAAGVQRALAFDPDDAYLAAWHRIAHLIDRLVDELMRLFDRDQRLRWRRGFSVGERLDLRVAMRFEAKPERYTELWMRKSLPTVIDPAFVLLMDRSGSMQGEGIQHALDAAVLLVEVCTRLQIPVEIWSFASDVSQDMAWDQSPDEAVRRSLGGLLSRTAGGTNMHGALNAVGARLMDCPHREPVLFVLSDGCASDVVKARAESRRIAADGVCVMGLGMGPDTALIAEVFSSAIAEISPDQFVDTLAERIRAQLTAHAA